MNRLLNIQQLLKAPKGQTNDFGHYRYRSCEDIVEAVKPLLSAQKLVLVMKDNMVQVGERYYIEALVELYDTDGKVIAYSTGYAREEETKKGMDGSQITGSSSSYARKYALCGLFAIDDGVDSDLTNKGETKVEKKEAVVGVAEDLPWFNDKELEQLKNNIDRVKQHSSSNELITSILTKYRISKTMKQQIADFRATL